MRKRLAVSYHRLREFGCKRWWDSVQLVRASRRTQVQSHLERVVTKRLAMALFATAVAGWLSPDHESP